MVKDWACDDGNATTLMDVGNSVPLYIHIGVHVFVACISCLSGFCESFHFFFFCCAYG